MDEFENKVTKLNEDEAFYNIMTVEEDRRRIMNSERELGIEEGIKKGTEQGILEANKKNAKAMLEDDVDINLIAKYTGLTVKEIEGLK